MTDRILVEVDVDKFGKGRDAFPYQTEGSAGFDIRARLDKPVSLHPNETIVVPTALSVAITDGFELQIRSRSGLAAKRSVVVLNSPGTVDSDYRGDIGVILHNFGDKDFVVEDGDRIAQGIFSKVYKAQMVPVSSSQLSDTDRGSGGFGSTGVK